jgi:hypothetical protein
MWLSATHFSVTPDGDLKTVSAPRTEDEASAAGGAGSDKAAASSGHPQAMRRRNIRADSGAFGLLRRNIPVVAKKPLSKHIVIIDRPMAIPYNLRPI